jgi:CheY-like chemotaxis protein
VRVYSPDDLRAKSITPESRGARLRGAVLLVEDNEFNAALVVELLSRMGLEVIHALDGEQAHRLACNTRFDVILMDCQMPKVDGYESTRRIRFSEKNAGVASVPIIALTANALSGDREKCLRSGMDDYLCKPYTANQLHAKLAAWLPTPKSTDANCGAGDVGVEGNFKERSTAD